jgi:hypothetical protein
MLLGRAHTHGRHTLSRSYGINLPSSLAQLHSIALGFSPCPPELVWGTSDVLQRLAAFLVSMGSSTSGPKSTASLLDIDRPDLPKRSVYELAPGYPTPGRTALLHPRITPHKRYGNINPFPIDYAFRPRLRVRLTLGGLPWPRKPWTFGGTVFHRPFTLLMLA